jgi:hypothetical protein
MVQQNKKPEVDAKRKALEAALLDEDTMDNIDDVDTGQSKILEKSRFQRKATTDNKSFRIRQGLRRRHPGRVLNQFQGMTQTSTESASLWEKALLHDTKRVDMPREYRVTGDSDGMVNQMGIVSVALDNYKASKQKFSRLHLVGI